MRAVERIDDFLARLGERWKTQNPDLRFTQFLFNIGIVNTDEQHHLEETQILKMMFPDLHPREYTYWGTFGKKGDQPLKNVLVKDLEVDHIEAILNTQKQITESFRNLLEEELAFRKT